MYSFFRENKYLEDCYFRVYLLNYYTVKSMIFYGRPLLPYTNASLFINHALKIFQRVTFLCARLKLTQCFTFFKSRILNASLFLVKHFKFNAPFFWSILHSASIKKDQGDNKKQNMLVLKIFLCCPLLSLQSFIDIYPLLSFLF